MATTSSAPRGTRGCTVAVLDFVATTTLADIPDEALHEYRRCIIDGVGLMLAGSVTAALGILRDRIRATGGRAEATVIGAPPLRAPIGLAALANGTSGHAHDFDDTQLSYAPDRIFGLLTHPTMAPLAAALALGESREVTGARFLEAFAVGFEVECRVAEAIDPNHYQRGFHSSGTLGTFGAAVAAAKMLNLDREAVARTLGIAASLCSGIRVNFGTMTKPLHVGRAAENGLLAADLGSRGFTAAPEALDGPWGFFQVFGGGADETRVLERLGRPFAVLDPGVSVKPYPCGVLGHPSMDAMLKLVTDHDVTPDRIAAIRLRAGSNILNPLRYRRAQNELEAKFCPAFMLSAIALRRKAGIHEFSDAFVTSAPVQQMMERVETIFDPAIEARGFDRIRSVVELDLTDGRTLVQAADERYRGGPERPFTRDELFAKFSECAAIVLPPPRVAEVFDRLGAIERVDNLRVLVELLAP